MHFFNRERKTWDVAALQCRMVFIFQCVASESRANDKASPPYELLTADVDSYQVVIYGKDGTSKWVYDKVRCIDTWLLSHDEILIAYLPSAKTQNKGGVRVVSKSKKVLFDYPLDDEVMSCCPLPNGKIHWGKLWWSSSPL